ncbi:hypothetical protein BGZ83_007634 [Gryganskiella cystojenkinii]|nr:hypothetical protein BGZ83_007634 [Gryganskiella cystojenkinii]
MSESIADIQAKKKKTPPAIGCDQCRRRKTKCDQASPTCGPCLYAGLMECTFLLGKTVAPRRKKSQKAQQPKTNNSEVEILQSRLETIESAYSERLSQMEQLLNRVMPAQSQVVAGSSNNATGNSKPEAVSASPGSTSGSNDMDSQQQQQQQQNPTLVKVTDRANVTSPEAIAQSTLQTWDQSGANVSMNSSHAPSSTLSPEIPTSSLTSTPIYQPLKSEGSDNAAQVPTSTSTTVAKSPASSIAGSLNSTTQEDDHEEYDDHVGDLAATMDKLRLFDASMYLGKGTMLFTSTDQNKFWDEEISFDVHDAQDIDLPLEAYTMPPVEVIDALIDIYYSTTLLQALEDRYEPQSIFLLNSVFMAAALTGDYQHEFCYTDPNDKKTLAAPFFDRARQVLDYCIGIPRVSTVQGLLLLSQYPKILGLGHHYVQQAILMAADLGLHRKCDRWIPDKQVQETRKRVFWCVYVYDSYTSSVTGRRPLLDDNEIDVSLLVPTSTEGEDEYSNTLFLVHMCKLWRIFRNVKRYVFNVTEVQDMVPGSLPKNYEQQLIQWQLQLPAALRFSFDMKVDDPEAMYNARGGVAQMLYESTLILLHKPYISPSEHVKRQPYRSQDICLKAASKITDISKVLIRTYSRTFEITGVPEYAMTNAIRIQAMYMKSTDVKVAEESVANFDYLTRFFREYYSSPRANIDEQTINCVLTFFDEFMHTVKGLSDSTVHICATAIKSMAIAKRNKIALGRLGGSAGGHVHHSVPKGGDDRQLSHLVKIGRLERAKVRGSAAVSPLAQPLGDLPSQPRKRYSDHDDSLRFKPSQYLLQTDVVSKLSPSSSATVPDDAWIYQHPGKCQKVSQFIGPFGGPLVVESLNQYQTSTAILNQPRAMSAIPPAGCHMEATSQVFQEFNHQQQQVQQQQQPQQQQPQQQQQHHHHHHHHKQQQQSHSPHQHQHQQQSYTPQSHVHQPQSTPQFTQSSSPFVNPQGLAVNQPQFQQQPSYQQQQQQLQSPQSPFHSNIGSMIQSSHSQPTFWGDLSSSGGGMMDTLQDVTQGTILGNVNEQTRLNGNSNNDNSNSGSMLGSNSQSMFGGLTSSSFNQSVTSQADMFMPMKMDSVVVDVNTNNNGGGNRQNEEMNAEQIQAFLSQTMAEDTHTNLNHHHHLGQGVGTSSNNGPSSFSQFPQPGLQPSLPISQAQQQQLQQQHQSFTNPSLDFDTSSWQSMM